MSPESTRYALAVIYSALVHATAAATGRPVDKLADHLVQNALAEGAPAEAARFLALLSQATPERPLGDLAA